MSLPYRLHAPGNFPDWVGEGRFVPQHRLPDDIDVTALVYADALLFVWQGNRLLWCDADHFPLGTLPDGLTIRRHALLGKLDGRFVLTLEVADGVEAPAGFSWTGLRSLFSQIDVGWVALAGRSFQVLEWERTHQFCGCCAAPMRMRSHERGRECTACSFVAYPRISPVVMGLVVREGQLLLARSPHFAPGMYSAVAGFVEVGESLEQALVREIQEETGIRAGNFQYFDSQPWPFPHSLMIAYTAEYLSGEPVPQPDEIEDVRWFDLKALPLLPPPISIAGRLIRAVVAHLQAPASNAQ